MGGSQHPPEVLDPNQQAQGRRVKRVSLSLGELVLPAPQASRVESPGGVGVEVGGLDPGLERLGWAPPHGRVVIPKFLQSLNSS